MIVFTSLHMIAEIIYAVNLQGKKEATCIVKIVFRIKGHSYFYCYHSAVANFQNTRRNPLIYQHAIWLVFCLKIVYEYFIIEIHVPLFLISS